MRLFVADDGVPDGVSELTDGDQQIVRVAAPDLQQARRVRARIRAGAHDVAVILDVTVAVAGDFRSAQHVLDPLILQQSACADGRFEDLVSE